MIANEKPRLTATNKVKAKLAECCLTNEKIAKELDISPQTFSYKLNNKVEFKASEIQKMCNILNITDKNAYFFCDEISQNG